MSGIFPKPRSWALVDRAGKPVGEAWYDELTQEAAEEEASLTEIPSFSTRLAGDAKGRLAHYGLRVVPLTDELRRLYERVAETIRGS
jgi:hypothetical protein